MSEFRFFIKESCLIACGPFSALSLKRSQTSLHRRPFSNLSSTVCQGVLLRSPLQSMGFLLHKFFWLFRSGGFSFFTTILVRGRNGTRVSAIFAFSRSVGPDVLFRQLISNCESISQLRQTVPFALSSSSNLTLTLPWNASGFRFSLIATSLYAGVRCGIRRLLEFLPHEQAAAVCCRLGRWPVCPPAQLTQSVSSDKRTFFPSPLPTPCPVPSLQGAGIVIADAPVFVAETSARPFFTCIENFFSESRPLE